MRFWKNRALLLSIRERPLSLLCLLAWLTPYLLFSVASQPHFHRSDFPGLQTEAQTFPSNSVPESSSASQFRATLSPAPQQSTPLHSAADCVSCQWQAGAHGMLLSAHPFSALPGVVCIDSLADVALFSLSARTVRVRGPPSLL